MQIIQFSPQKNDTVMLVRNLNTPLNKQDSNTIQAFHQQRELNPKVLNWVRQSQSSTTIVLPVLNVSCLKHSWFWLFKIK